MEILLYLFELTLSITCFASWTDGANPCPAPWIHFHTSCYVFATGYPEDWTEAGSFCNRMGAKLAEIETAEENNFLRLHAIDNYQQTGGSFWIGGTDVLIDGQWIWITTQKRMSYTDWNPGEPNGALRESCLMLHNGKSNFHWNDQPCDSKLFFICEKELPNDGDPSTIIG
ncbi:perlucin-like [Saccostrea echinata]|uniref:perlucin-like n=1 Tax=Saccostrea echinata TaxID=191078 RepID=UPI002A83BA1D|nr:perlucin-like [Saccostrea echinata]